MKKSQVTSSKHIEHIRQNLRLNHKEQFEQKETLESTPVYVAVPTGQKCNLRCLFCTNRKKRKKYSDLSQKQFLRYIEPVDNASRVQLYGWGEPFVNPDYESIFDYFIGRYPGTRIHISTNGILLTDKWIEKLLNYGKCLINVSLNAATRETYTEIMGFDMFERVVSNLHQLIRAKKKVMTDEFVITLSFVTIKQNIHELSRFVELCAELGILHAKLVDLDILSENHRSLFLGEGNKRRARRIFLEAHRKAKDRGISLNAMIHYPVSYFKQDRTAYTYSDLPFDLQPVWKQMKDVLFYPQLGECYEPWQTFMVSQSGAVFTCCRGREIMGNLLKQSFREIWNGAKYRNFRRSINSFRPPQVCRVCPVKMGYDTI